MTLSGPTKEPTLRELRGRFSRGEDTPLAATQRMFDRIDALDSELHAFLATDRETAYAAAELATEAWEGSGSKPPLLGIPISVKDTIEVAGMPTTYGSQLFRTNRQPDSVVAQRLRAAGAIIVGKTNTPEFALITEVRNRLTPPGTNPLDHARTAGGSSGGAATSVAAGMSVAALGTDSAGSIRIPAAYQGLVGFKPSYQRIPWVQTWKASLTRSHVGPITQDVADAWELTQILSGIDWRDPSSRWSGLQERQFSDHRALNHRQFRAAVLTDDGEDCNAEDRRLLEELIAEVEQRFESVERLQWREVLPASQPTGAGGWTYAGEHVAGALALCPELPDRLDELTEYARPHYEWGLEQPAHEYLRGVGDDRLRGLHLAHELGRFDCVFTLSASEAPLLAPEESYVPKGFPLLGALNLAGLPAVSIPFGRYESGMPRAIQVVGRYGEDARILAIAEQFAHSE